MKWFKDVKTIEELKKKYKELLRKYHPDNPNSSAEITKEINTEFDALCAVLRHENDSDGQSPQRKKKPRMKRLRQS